MARLLSILIFTLTVAVGALFALLNAQSVPFHYYWRGGWGETELPLALLLSVAFAVGALLGILSAIPRLVRRRRRSGRAARA